MRVGVDLGGTKTEIVVLGKSNAIELRHRIPTSKKSYQSVLAGIHELVLEADKYVGSKLPVGVGIPGALTHEKKVKNANLTLLNGMTLAADLELKLKRPIRVANDANCFALSEAIDGAASGEPTVFGVIAGTGCGGGIVINQKILGGANSIAGEWGHNPLPGLDTEETAPSCYCGKFGCVETFLSGTGFENDFLRLTGKSLTGKEIIALASQDPSAEKCIQSLEKRFARALGTIINILDPHCIVLGGGVSNIDRLYSNIPKLWQQHIASRVINTKLVRAKHGDSSGVRGAAWLWPEE